jgi:hypothetical protein
LRDPYFPVDLPSNVAQRRSGHRAGVWDRALSQDTNVAGLQGFAQPSMLVVLEVPVKTYFVDLQFERAADREK